MAIKKVKTLQEYSALKHPDGESEVTLVAEENRLMYNGVNVQVMLPMPGDAIYKNAAGELFYIAHDTLKINLVSPSWIFVDLYYHGWSEDLYVDLGLPSGLLWAKKNIDITQPDGFAVSPFQNECSFCSWGNTDMYNPNENKSFSNVHTWDSSGSTQIYDLTPGASITASIAADSGYDAARENLGTPWRLPSREEFQELLDNCKFIDADGNEVPATNADKRVYVNKIRGIYLQSKINGKRIFIACAGTALDTRWVSYGGNANYWTSTIFSNQKYANYFLCNVNDCAVRYVGRQMGCPIRPVQ